MVGDKESTMNNQGINSGAHSATLKGKINALEVNIDDLLNGVLRKRSQE